MMGSAYIDSANTKVILVFVNVSSSSKEIQFNFSGLDSLQQIKYLTPYITSDNAGDNLKAYNAVSVDSIYTVPAKSVVTMVGMLDGSAITGIQTGRKKPLKNSAFTRIIRILLTLPQQLVINCPKAV